MKQDEKLAYRYLESQGYKSIEFEPNGISTPPDFLIENNIAIEVRRMNKHIKNRPIEEIECGFVHRFEKLLQELDNPSLPYSIAVALRYKRPIKLSKDLFESLKQSISSSTVNELFGQEILFNTQISYELYKGKGRAEDTYRLCSISDKDKGGIVQDARYEALKICIEDKTQKLQKLKNNYKELWLILVDDIFSRVDNTTQQDFQRFPEIKSIFKRIIIISKSDESKWIDIYPWGQES
ncbi:MAG: hypothetical protein M0Q51_16890 [Bacteroidales bacterium]|nr:hypothetical protein [Bacteroidales bacterium]